MWRKNIQCRHPVHNKTSCVAALSAPLDHLDCSCKSEAEWGLRARYWIVRGRSFVRKILHQCVTCRRFEGGTHPLPPLPSFRVKEAPACAYTGVDYAGPLYLREASNPGNAKVWIYLYTCCVVRAIHLEVIPDMMTQSFIRSFKRFTTRRGFPVKMVSDNGKTFTSVAKVLMDIVKHPEVEEYLTQTRIQWSFNQEKAPWWGGIS